MEAIFGGNQATGWFAMASNEPLGTPTDFGQLDCDAKEEITNLGTEADSGKGTDMKDADEGRGGKRRRLTQEEVDLMTGMTEAVKSVGEALKAPQHNEVHQDLYGYIMGTPGYEQEALMYALVYLLKNKAEGFCFV